MNDQPKSAPISIITVALAAIVSIVIAVLSLFVAQLGFIVNLAILSCWSFLLFNRDTKPWDRSRVAIALLIACFLDEILFNVSKGTWPRAYRQMVPSFVVISIYAGYLAWRATAEYSDRERAGDSSILDADRHPPIFPGAAPLAIFGALCLAIFLWTNVEAPIINHYAPWYFPMTQQSVNDGEP